MAVQKPHIVLDEYGEVESFRWCPIHEGPLNVPKEDILPYYEAYACLAKLIEQSPHIMYHKFASGDVIAINNRTMLHGRTEIKPNGGQRILNIGYLSLDEVESKFKILARKLGRQDEK